METVKVYYQVCPVRGTTDGQLETAQKLYPNYHSPYTDIVIVHDYLHFLKKELPEAKFEIMGYYHVLNPENDVWERKERFKVSERFNVCL